MKGFHLLISSPDGNVFSGESVFLAIRGAEGDLAVMAGHAPFTTSVQPCVCRVEFDDGEEKFFDIGGGLLTVADNKVTLLSSSCKEKKQ